LDEPVVITSEDDIRFLVRKTPFRQIFEVSEYRFQDIRNNDRVLDIGANVGAFCIRAARQARSVTAVEPVTASILADNIRQNNAGVRLIEAGLGDGSPAVCTWDEQSARVPTFTLGTLISMAGGCDFLKCDCEGAEWKIRPFELEGIRRIEMELHLPPICDPPDMALLDYISRHYDFEIERKPCHDVLGVMGILHAERR
jgi:FkbM family methyltransferase